MLDSKWHTVCGLGIWTLNALIFIAMVFTLFPANSAPKPNYAARLTADFHLQLEVTSLQLPNNMPGQCIVSGTIVRLFRAHADTLDAGGSLHVPVLCTVANGEAPLPAHPWAKCPGCFKRQWCCCRTWCGRHCFG